MVDLSAKGPVADMLPISVGGVTLAECHIPFVTHLHIRAGQSTALSKALEAAHGMALPARGETTGAGAQRAVWFGSDRYLLLGEAAADPALTAQAALADQSDAWVILHLTGPAGADVLARHCPLDLRLPGFGTGKTARAPVAHLPSVVTRLDNGFEVMVLQSLARTAVHHLRDAMKSVAAQAELA